MRISSFAGRFSRIAIPVSSSGRYAVPLKIAAATGISHEYSRLARRRRECAILSVEHYEIGEASPALLMFRAATVFVLAMMRMKMNRIWSAPFRLLTVGSK
jgi:hypothetical protein